MSAVNPIEAPPYRVQWESASLVAEFLAGRDPATDPLWRNSGATDAAEYARWAEHLCGCACLQMALVARGRAMPSMHDIRRAVQAHGGYVEAPDGAIRGLIYAGAVAWLGDQGIAARIALDVAAETLPGNPGDLFIASVHPGIRQPDVPPPARGGHLVLVFARTPEGALRFHNPSGLSPDTHLPTARFADFFAGRGILLPG